MCKIINLMKPDESYNPQVLGNGQRNAASVIQSKLDYSCAAYSSARAPVLRLLDLVHHQGLQLVPASFRTSLIASLYVADNE